MRWLLLTIPLLMLSGCALFQNSEPIDVAIAKQLVSNAEQLREHSTYAADILDNTRENDWDAAESMSLRLLLDANVALAEEALSNAEEKNADD